MYEVCKHYYIPYEIKYCVQCGQAFGIFPRCYVLFSSLCPNCEKAERKRRKAQRNQTEVQHGTM